MLHDQGRLLAVVRALDRHDVQLVKHDRLGVIEDVVGGVGQDGLAAHDTVDHGTRGTAATEALELVTAGNVLIRLGDVAVDLGSWHGNGGNDLGALGPLGGDGDVQRSSWCKALAAWWLLLQTDGCAFGDGAGERTRTFTGCPTGT